MNQLQQTILYLFIVFFHDSLKTIFVFCKVISACTQKSNHTIYWFLIFVYDETKEQFIRVLQRIKRNAKGSQMAWLKMFFFIHMVDPKEVMTWHLNSFPYLKGEKRHLMCSLEHHSMRPYFICHKSKLDFLIRLIFIHNDKI